MAEPALVIPPQSRAFAAKRRLSRASRALGMTAAATAVCERRPASLVRAVNYHAVPAANAGRFAEHLEYFARRYQVLNAEGLSRFLAGEALGERRPGLVLTFDDADPTHCHVVGPMLRERGLTGWFFVPVERLGQRSADGGVDTMTLDELREVARDHIVGSHTQTHRFLGAEVNDADLHFEVVEARRRLEQLLARPIDAFAWTGGAEHHYSSRAAVLVHDTYRFGFISNSHPVRIGADAHRLYRTNIEAFFDLDLVRFQLSGLMDVRFRGVRRRVDRVLLAGLSKRQRPVPL